MDAWNVAAEVLGVLSGLLLLFPAMALNRHLRRVKEAEDGLQACTGELTRAIAGKALPVLKEAKIPTWSERDQRMLFLGVLAFVLSSCIKLAIAFQPPAKPAAAGQVPPEASARAASAPQ